MDETTVFFDMVPHKSLVPQVKTGVEKKGFIA